MATNNHLTAYNTTSTITASKTKLLVMLHDGAIRFLSQAAIATKKKDYNAKSISFNKAIRIIDHLWDSLDHERGGEIAANLEQIYSYLHVQLMQANTYDDIGIIREVMGHLREIREAWAQVDRMPRKVDEDSPIESRTESTEGLSFAA